MSFKTQTPSVSIATGRALDLTVRGAPPAVLDTGVSAL